jgi:2-oxoglutarate dehydrogenase E1 component
LPRGSKKNTQFIMKDFQYITNSHPSYIEGLYNDFVKDPNSVEAEMRKFFEGFDFAISNGAKVNGTAAIEQPSTANQIDWMNEIRVYRMILGYRNKGHLIADTNPIRKRKDRGANIELDFYGFTEADLDKTFNAGNLIGLGTTALKNIIAHLQNISATKKKLTGLPMWLKEQCCSRWSFLKKNASCKN